MSQTHAACADELLTSSDISRLAAGEVTPATVRLDATLGRIAVAFTTPRGQRLYRRDAALAYLAARAARRAERFT